MVNSAFFWDSEVYLSEDHPSRKLTFGFAILIPSTVGLIGESNHFRSISKLTEFDDYAINDVIFQATDDLWGPHTVDRFACSYNAKLPRFNSRFSFNPVLKLSKSAYEAGGGGEAGGLQPRPVGKK